MLSILINNFIYELPLEKFSKNSFNLSIHSIFSILKDRISEVSIDNFSKKQIENENGVCSILSTLTIQDKIKQWNENNSNKIKFEICDLLNHRSIYSKLKEFVPDAIIHYAEQPSAPYSMKDRSSAYFTQMNNVMGNLNLLFLSLIHI